VMHRGEKNGFLGMIGEAPSSALVVVAGGAAASSSMMRCLPAHNAAPNTSKNLKWDPPPPLHEKKGYHMIFIP
jgi:hypothetical protein